MSIIDYLRDFNSPQSGQKRRQFIENMFDFEEYIPPNLRAPTQFVLDANPVTGMGNSVTESRVAFDPTRSADERKRAGLNMMMEVGMAAAPAVLGRMGYLTPPVALAETFAAPTPTSEGIKDATTGLLSDLQYGARSIAEGNPRGVLEAFQSGGQPTALSAGAVGSNAGRSPLIMQYSPTLQAAENLQQDKGTFEQMKAMLLKGGGKAEEMDWSGFNKQFRNDKIVTKEDIVRYFTDQDVRLEPQVLKNKSGVTYSLEDTERDEAFNELWSDIVERFENNRANRLISSSPEQNISQSVDPLSNQLFDGNVIDEAMEKAEALGAERFEVDDYGPIELKELADEVGLTTEQLADMSYSGQGMIYETEDGVYVFDDAMDLLKEYEPSEYYDVLTELRLEFQGAFDEDAPAMIARLREQDATENNGLGLLGTITTDLQRGANFDAGDTKFSQYFPDGAAYYTETVFRYNPVTDEIENLNYVGKRGHFPNKEGQIVHSRVGDFKLETGLNPGLVDNVRYIGEVQSDLGQSFQRMKRAGADNATPANYEETALTPKLVQANLSDDFSRSFENQQLKFTKKGEPLSQSAGNREFTELSRDFIEATQRLSGYGYRSGYLNYTPEPINIITDNILAHNLLLNHRGISNTAMHADPYKLKSINGLDFNKIDHTDILDIVYNRRQPENATQASAFTELKTQFLENTPPRFQDRLRMLNMPEPSQGFHIETFMSMVPMMGDFKMSNNFLYTGHKPDISEELAMELDQPLTDIFENLDFSTLSTYTDRVREAHVDKISEMNRFAEARNGEINIGRDGAPLLQLSGPTAKNEKQWAPYVLRHEITKAVNDDMDVIAIPYSKKSIGKAGGNDPEDVKGGSVKYYRENLVNYLTDIFKKFDPKFAKQIKDDIASGEFTLKTEGETAVGFRLTQEMKDKIRAAGVPTFGVAGGIGLTNFMLQDEQRQQPNSLLGGI
jgi:hypothetical protein